MPVETWIIRGGKWVQSAGARLFRRSGVPAPWGNILTLVILNLSVQVAILVVDAQLPTGHILEYPNTRSPAEVYTVIECYEDKRLNCYKEGSKELYVWSKVVLDGLFPILYATLLSLLLAGAAGKASSNVSSPLAERLAALRKVMAFLPFAAMAADYLENTAIVIMLISSSQLLWVAQAQVIFTAFKWDIIIVCLVGLVILWIFNSRAKSGRVAGRSELSGG